MMHPRLGHDGVEVLASPLEVSWLVLLEVDGVYYVW